MVFIWFGFRFFWQALHFKCLGFVFFFPFFNTLFFQSAQLWNLEHKKEDAATLGTGKKET